MGENRMRFYLLPACSETPHGKSPKDHYQHTIDQPVDFSVYYENGTLSDYEWKQIISVFPSGKARVWGSLPTSTKNNYGEKVYLDKPPSSYEKLNIDDVVFTYINWSNRKHRIDALLKCALKLHNREIAEQLWDINNDGETWEYIFLLKEYTQLDYPSKVFFENLDYSNPPNGFTPISKEKQQMLIGKYGGIYELFNHLKVKNIDLESLGETILQKKKLKKPSSAKSISRSPSGNDRDYVNEQKENSKTGYDGERHVLAFEKKMLLEHGRKDLAEKIEHTAITNDNAGFDIKSFYPDGAVKYIEVKSTQSPPSSNTTFYLSQNELEKAKEYGSHYCIYRVFNARDENAIITPIEHVSKQVEEEMVELTPLIYRCRISYQ